MINIEDFAKIELKVGKILEAYEVEGADKLYRFTVDLGETKTVTLETGEEVTEQVYRTILSGVRQYFSDINVFVGKNVCVVSNLAPRKLRGFESNGMILFAGGDSGSMFMVSPIGEDIAPGTLIR